MIYGSLPTAPGKLFKISYWKILAVSLFFINCAIKINSIMKVIIILLLLISNITTLNAREISLDDKLREIWGKNI